MTTFVDLYFPPELPVERDEVQAAIEADLGSVVQVVGAGVGEAGSNLDLEIVGQVGIEYLLGAAATLMAIASLALSRQESKPPRAETPHVTFSVAD